MPSPTRNHINEPAQLPYKKFSLPGAPKNLGSSSTAQRSNSRGQSSSASPPEKYRSLRKSTSPKSPPPATSTSQSHITEPRPTFPHKPVYTSTATSSDTDSIAVSSATSISSHYSSLIDTTKFPEPGPSFYAARRALWLDAPAVPPRPCSPSPSRIKLEALLTQPGAVESEEVWRAGLSNVWKGLVGGNQLRKRLPLSIVIKILQAGWLRDGTWPEGGVAPEDDMGVQSSVQLTPTNANRRTPTAEPPPVTATSTPATSVGPTDFADDKHNVATAIARLQVISPRRTSPTITAKFTSDGRLEGG